MQYDNPAGLDGFDFLEFSTPNPTLLAQQFETLGLNPVAKHKNLSALLYQQNDIRFIINTTKESLAMQFAEAHGPCVFSMGFRVKDAQFAYQHALTKGAKPYLENPSHVPAIYGVGGSLIYFVDYENGLPNYWSDFEAIPARPASPKAPNLTYIDHVTHNLYRGNMGQWADFYTRIFNFREVRYFDIEGRMTGLKSQAMTSPCNKIRIPLNESADDQSQIEEFLKDFKGEGIQHIALGSDDIYASVHSLKNLGLVFLDTPDTYYDLIEQRLPKHGERTDELKKLRILIDGETRKDKKLLLQIFTKNMLGPVFFEIIQRKGDEGFGEGNFRALFESIELDQIHRGVLANKTEETI